MGESCPGARLGLRCRPRGLGGDVRPPSPQPLQASTFRSGIPGLERPVSLPQLPLLWGPPLAGRHHPRRPQDGPNLLPPKMLWSRERDSLTHGHGQTQEASWLRCWGGGLGRDCQGPFPAGLPLPCCSRGPSPHPARPKRHLQSSRDRDSTSQSLRSVPQRRVVTEDRATTLSKAPRSRARAGVEPRFLDLCSQPSPARFEASSPGPWGDWRKMQSDQLSAILLIKITTTPFLPGFQPFTYIPLLVLRPRPPRGDGCHRPLSFQ